MYGNLYYFFLLFILFFFKQKTAYEIRISDWSSDVCSSDLVPLRPHARAEGAAAARRFRGQPYCSLAAPKPKAVDVGEVEVARDHDPHFRALIDAKHRLNLHRVPQNRVRCLAGNPCDIIRVGDFRGGDRSEAHTSELQSLMRITYPVFCLN